MTDRRQRAKSRQGHVNRQSPDSAQGTQANQRLDSWQTTTSDTIPRVGNERVAYNCPMARKRTEVGNGPSVCRTPKRDPDEIAEKELMAGMNK